MTLFIKICKCRLKAGKFSYYLWLRNGLPMNHNVFATAAIAYDKEGNAYNLGVSDVLRWSGDERYFTTPDDPNVAAMAAGIIMKPPCRKM